MFAGIQYETCKALRKIVSHLTTGFLDHQQGSGYLNEAVSGWGLATVSLDETNSLY